jgi:hypothetical protein
VRRAPLLAVVALVAAVSIPSAGAATKGEQRVLVVLASAGSRPYSVAEVERTISDAGAFIRASSFGQVRMSADITPWLTAFSGNPGCGGSTTRSLEAVVAPARVAADLAGYNAALYDEVIYALGDSRCGFHGATWGHEVMLTRQPNVQLVVHELGHAFGLGHAQASDCAFSALRCGIEDTGDPFSPMGSGLLDFSAYEKSILGWIPPQPRITAAKRYILAPPTSVSKLAQALLVDTMQGTWWIEYRAQPFRGLLLRLVPSETPTSPLAPSAIVILRPTKAADRPWLAKGQSYRLPFSWRVTLTEASATRAEVRFRP